MKRVRKLVGANGTRKDGKPNWVTMGSMFKKEDGSVVLKIDSIPAGEWNGWVNVWDLDENRQQQMNNLKQQHGIPQQAAPPPIPGAPQQFNGEVSDDIPF